MRGERRKLGVCGSRDHRVTVFPQCDVLMWLFRWHACEEANSHWLLVALSIPAVTGHKARVTSSPNYLHLGFGLTAGERKGTFTLSVAFEIVSLHCAV